MDNNNNLTIKQLRLKYQKEGYDSLTNNEKVRLLLSYSEKAGNVDEAAEKIIKTYGNIHTSSDSDALFLMNICGMSESSTALLKLIQVINNLCTLNEYSNLKLDSSENAKKFFHAFLKNSCIEKTVIITANKFFNFTNKCILSEGKADKVDISFRKIYEFAQNNNAKYIFVSHCHPNGSPIPSTNDINTTLKIQDTLDLIDIPLVDHIIVGCDEVLSMREYSENKIFHDVPRYKINTTTGEW